MDLFMLTSLLAAHACTNADATPAVGRPYRGFHAFTLQLGQSENPETVRLVPNGTLAVLGSSKAKRVTLVQVEKSALTVLRTRALFPDDSGESELTNLALNPTGDWAVVTHSLETRDPDTGAQTSCGGEILFVNTTDSVSFGTILGRVPVGPMPDAVAVSSDGHWVAVANERDSAWGGKCQVPGYSGSVSLVDISQGLSAAIERSRVTMLDDDTDGREPESLTFAADNDLLAVTLQDSHEVAFMRISALVDGPAWDSDDVQLVRLPTNSLGMDPWPDGIVAFRTASGAEYFAVAGEWNDTLMILDLQGRLVTNHEIVASEVPSDFPRDLSGEAPLFRPDSLAVFEADGSSYLAATLKHSGAIGIWEVKDPATMTVADVVKVGNIDAGTPTTPSTVGSEGLAASANGDTLVCANEGEGSISLVRPAP